MKAQRIPTAIVTGGLLARGRAAARAAALLRIARLPGAALGGAGDLVEHPVGLRRLLLVRSRGLLRRRPLHHAPRWPRASTGPSCGHCRWRRWSRRCSAWGWARWCSASRASAASCSRCCRSRSPSCSHTIVVNTPIDGGPGVYLNAVPVPKIGPTPSSTFYLLALAAAVLTMLVSWGIHSSKFGAGLFAIHDDEDAAEVVGVPTYRLKLMALARLLRAGGRGRRHPCAVHLLRHRERGVQHHRAADGGADERARRHAPLGRARGRRGGDHRLALFVHRRRIRGARQGGDRRDPDGGDPVHAGRHPRAAGPLVSPRAAGRRAAKQADFAPTMPLDEARDDRAASVAGAVAAVPRQPSVARTTATCCCGSRA